MKIKPIVSVIIPAFNVGKVIGQTLSSVRDQTFRDFEVIINVDAGSIDDTQSIVAEFCRTDPRFILICSPHANRPAARNQALHFARGEIVAFLDADDIWLPEKLACQMAFFSGDPRINFSFTNYYFWDGEQDLGTHYRKHKQLPEGNPVRNLIFACVFGTSTVMVKRTILTALGGFDASLEHAEDWDMWMRISEYGMHARGTALPLVRYRLWPGNCSKQKLNAIAGDILMLEKRLGAICDPVRRRFLGRTLQRTRSKLQLAFARHFTETAPEKVPATLWQAWQTCPQDVKWLWRWLLVIWPQFFGGKFTTAMVHKKLREKF